MNRIPESEPSPPVDWWARLSAVLAWLKQAVMNTDRVSLYALLAANLIPVVFAVLCGWQVGGVVFFYWMENLVIGFYAILRLALAGWGTGNSEKHGSKAFLIPFFTVHYFFFCFIHGVFLAVFFSGVFSGEGPDKLHGGPFSMLGNLVGEFFAGSPLASVLAVLGLVVSHGVSFVRNYLIGGEYRNTDPGVEMFRPYGRIVLLHVCILFGGFFVLMVGSSTPLVVLFMLAKTGLDVLAHSREHRVRRDFREARREAGKPGEGN